MKVIWREGNLYMSDYTTEDYLYWLVHGKTAEDRMNAAWRVGRARDPRGVEALALAAGDSDAGVRLRVAEALATTHDPQTFAPLRLLLGDEDADVRAMAAQSLGRVGDSGAAGLLLEALADEGGAVRASAAEALGALGIEEAVQPLLGAFIHDEDSTVRHACRKSLVSLGAVDALMGVMPDHWDDFPVLIDLIETLAQMGDRRAVVTLAPLANHPQADVRTVTAWAVRQLGG